jgi:hypothetical protein
MKLAIKYYLIPSALVLFSVFLSVHSSSAQTLQSIKLQQSTVTCNSSNAGVLSMNSSNQLLICNGTTNLPLLTGTGGATALNAGYITGGTFGSLSTAGNYIFDTNTLAVDATNDRVGVGIATPGYKFEVQAGAGVAGYFQTTSDNQLMLKSTDTWTGIGFDDSGATNYYIWYNGGNGTFSIGGGGASVSGKKLHVDGGMSIGANYDASINPANGLIVEGNVGIGTATPDPAAKLHVNGNLMVGGVTSIGGIPTSLRGLVIQKTISATGNNQYLMGLNVNPTYTQDVITSGVKAHAIYVNTPVTVGTNPAIVSQLYLEDVGSLGTDNYSIYSAGGKSYFAGNVSVGGAISSGKFNVFAGGAAGVSWSTGFNIGDASNYTGLLQDGGVSRWRNFGTGGYAFHGSDGSQHMTLSNGGNLNITGSVTAASFSGSGASLTGVAATSFSGSLAGDVTGTQGATVVGDDSHAHTAGTISGLGVGDFSSANISQWTNNSGYLTSVSGLTVSSFSSPNISQWTNNSNYITDGNTGWDNSYGFMTNPVGTLLFSGNGTDSGQSPQYYGIYQESGGWINPYPDLNIRYHTGIKMEAYYGYNGIRFYNGYDSTGNLDTDLAFAIGDGDQTVRSYQSFYAPIMYDQDSASYYVDPNSTSNLNSVRLNRVAFNGGSTFSTGNYLGIGNGAAYNNLNSIAVDTLETDGGVGGSGTLELNYYGGNEVYIGSGGSKAIRASVFYDGSTGYYLNPAGNSILSDVQTNGVVVTGINDQFPSGVPFMRMGIVYIGGNAGHIQAYNTSDATDLPIYLEGSVINLWDDGTYGNLNANKINAAEVDPPYTIGGKKYATYMAGMTGLKEETTGVVKLSGGKYVMDLAKAEDGSDLWMFYKTANLEARAYVAPDGKVYRVTPEEIWGGVVVLLTPGFDGSVWYEKADGRIIIHGSKDGEVSYRLTAPRFDVGAKDGNRRPEFESDGITKTIEGLNLDKLIK